MFMERDCSEQCLWNRAWAGRCLQVFGDEGQGWKVFVD